MRNDMFKVIVERPRSGRSWATKSKLRYLQGEAPKRITGHRLVAEHTGATKNLNENLAPLKRYLSKQVGRRWDHVFSDICKTLDTGSTVKMHVREHIGDFIIRQVHIDKAGTYWGQGHWGQPVPLDRWSQALYVCPDDGRVKRVEALRKRLGVEGFSYGRQDTKMSEDIIRRLSGRDYLVFLKGIWYSVSLSRALPRGYRDSEIKSVYDHLNGQAEREPKWSVTSKRQLSGKQLKALGLKNKGGGYYE